MCRNYRRSQRPQFQECHRAQLLANRIFLRPPGGSSPSSRTLVGSMQPSMNHKRSTSTPPEGQNKIQRLEQTDSIEGDPVDTPIDCLQLPRDEGPRSMRSKLQEDLIDIFEQAFETHESSRKADEELGRAKTVRHHEESDIKTFRRKNDSEIEARLEQAKAVERERTAQASKANQDFRVSTNKFGILICRIVDIVADAYDERMQRLEEQCRSLMNSLSEVQSSRGAVESQNNQQESFTQSLHELAALNLDTMKQQEDIRQELKEVRNVQDDDYRRLKDGANKHADLLKKLEGNLVLLKRQQVDPKEVSALRHDHNISASARQNTAEKLVAVEKKTDRALEQLKTVDSFKARSIDIEKQTRERLDKLSQEAGDINKNALRVPGLTKTVKKLSEDLEALARATETAPTAKTEDLDKLEAKLDATTQDIVTLKASVSRMEEATTAEELRGRIQILETKVDVDEEKMKAHDNDTASLHGRVAQLDRALLALSNAVDPDLDNVQGGTNMDGTPPQPTDQQSLRERIEGLEQIVRQAIHRMNNLCTASMARYIAAEMARIYPGFNPSATTRDIHTLWQTQLDTSVVVNVLRKYVDETRFLLEKNGIRPPDLVMPNLLDLPVTGPSTHDV